MTCSLAVYLLALFDRSLDRTTAQILAYATATFLAFVFGNLLINLRWLDRLFGPG